MVGPFGEAISQSIPKLDISRRVRHPPDSHAVGDEWFASGLDVPQLQSYHPRPGRSRDEPWVHRGVWNVPMDDTHTLKYGVFAIPKQNPEADREMLDYCNRHIDYNPAEHHEALFERREFPTEP